MACFDNIVALKELCTSVTPVSGVYLNDVGVDLNLVSSVITKSDGTVQEFVDAKINFAIEQVKTEVYSKFSNRIVARTLVDNARVGYTSPNMVSVTGGGNRGVFFQVYNNANYFQLEIAGIDLQTNFTGTIPVFIYDLDQAKLLETVNITSVAGEISQAFPHLTFTSNKKYLNLWIGYDATGINSYKTTTTRNPCCGVVCNRTEYVKVTGTTATSFIESGLTNISDTAGISITYSLACDPYGWICTQARLLALPIAYKVAAEIYRQAILQTPQTRSNNATTVNTELLDRNYSFYVGKYEETMKAILSNMSLPNDSICFECRKPVRNTVILP